MTETAIKDAARKLLTSEQLLRWRLGDNEESALVGKVLASKQEILKMLSAGETESFIEAVVDSLEELTALIPAIDETVGKKSRQSK